MFRLTLSLLFMVVCSSLAVPPEGGPQGEDASSKKIHAASDEGQKAIPRFRVPDGLKVELVAAEPLLANPVAFCIDHRGRFLVAETFRLHHGVTDNRSHMNWLDDELACRTVADRLAMYKKYLGKEFADYGKEEDRVRLVEDTNGDGKADKATVFAGGFRNPEDGIGSGVLARGDTVWYTNIPHLWQLKDTKGAGQADVKKSLQSGYGIHVAFLGHDLHGLRFGPDGKLYFSIGDRGLHVPTDKGVISSPDTGAVLRCNPDGSELEIVHTGLRNPQELVFDQFGNLFTGDNNADHGDSARWVQVIEGGDTGWRLGYQYLKSPMPLGPWNSEKMWHLPHPTQAAFLVPPLAHLANGPSGLTYNPGVTTLPDTYKDHFFLVDFKGSPGISGIHSFQVKPKGASFEVVNRQQFLWSVLATDAEFGPDGGFYLTDWVDGWRLPYKGRIYKVTDPKRVNDPAVLEVKKLLAEGMEKRPTPELVHLLSHADQRIRQEAQFALADRKAVKELEAQAQKGALLARLHAIWGLGQIGEGYPTLLEVSADAEAEVRAQAIKVLGEGRHFKAADRIKELLKDPEPRVRMFAALAAGRLAKAELLPAVVEMLKANADADAYLRHAGVMALTGIARESKQHVLLPLTTDSDPSVRLATVLAMRRLAKPEIAVFLKDAEPRVATEAARSIIDVPILPAFPALADTIHKPLPAALAKSPFLEPYLYRVLNANFRLGKKEHAQALAEFAAHEGSPEAVRLEALKMLSEWAEPSGRDRVIGLWRPLAARPPAEAGEAVRETLGGIMTGPNKVRTEGAKLAAKFGIKEIGPALREMVVDTKRPVEVRVETLKALETLKDIKLQEVSRQALEDREPRLRHQARAVLLKSPLGEKVLESLGKVLETGDLVERQGGFDLLARVGKPEADRTLDVWLDRLLAGKAPPEVHLDILEAARLRKIPELKEKLDRYEAGRKTGDHLAKYRETLAGGDPEAGRKVFLEKSEVSCHRCHKLEGSGGDVGPEITGIGKREKREYLLEAIVAPDKAIAKNYDTVILVLLNGQVKTGILKSEDKKEVRLMTAEGQLISVPVNQIEERQRGKSSMPEDLVQRLTLVELRDLVEFMAGLQKGP